MTTTISTTYPEKTRVNPWTTSVAIGFYFAFAKLLLHFLTNGHYDYVRDEFYFIAQSEHLDWGYVDVAPLVPLIAKLTRTLLGDSLFALRFLPAVAGAAKVLLSGMLVREFGGGRFATLLACLCVLLAPIYLNIDNWFSTNVFEPVFWLGCVFCVVRVLNCSDPRYWLWFGICAGLGLENKHSMLILGLGVFIGLLLTSARRFFRDKWFWIGGTVAFALFLPNLIWQFQHDWATFELLTNIQNSGLNIILSPPQYIAQQLLFLHPVSAPIWIAGLWFFFFDPKGSRYRVLGFAYVVILTLMIALKAKSYYAMPIYPMLFAGGAVVWERLYQRKPSIRWFGVSYLVLFIISGIVAAPLALPILPVETHMRYRKALHFKQPRVEVRSYGRFHPFFGDMFGWREMVETVARVYHALPSDEHAKTAIFASNYGQAGAVDFFGPRYGLPKAISPNQTYYLWGPRDYTGEVMIVLGWDRATAENRCDRAEAAAAVKHPYSVPKEHYTIFVCRGLKWPLKEVWPMWKDWQQ